MTDRLLSSEPLWSRTAPPAQRFAPLTAPLTVDVAVVGGGIGGIAAALALAEGGARVAVLEAGTIGSGAIGRSSGYINAGMWVPPDDLCATLGADYGERLIACLGAAPVEVFGLVKRHSIACEPDPRGTLHCAVGASGLRDIEARVRAWQKRGADVDLLSGDETARRTGVGHYRGALLDRRAGTVQPLGYLRGLAMAAARAGAMIHEGSAVTQYRQAGDAWILTTAAAEIRATRVMIMADIYAAADAFQLKSEFSDLRYFNLATTPLSAAIRDSVMPSGQGFIDTKKVLTSCRLDAAGRLIFGSVGALAGLGSGIHLSWARRAVAKLFPALAGITFDCGWFGSIGMTRSHLPAIHEPAPGVFSLNGYNGRGIAAGTVLGRLLAEHVLGRLPQRDLPLPITPLDPARGRILQEWGFEWGARGQHWVGARAV